MSDSMNRYGNARKNQKELGRKNLASQYSATSTTSWAVRTVLIAAVSALLGFVLLGWMWGVGLGVLWLVTAAVLRVAGQRAFRESRGTTGH